MMSGGYEMLRTPDGKGDGVFTTRAFRAGETVIVGEVECRAQENHSHATQVGPSEYVLLAGLGPKVNHSCDPNCGVRVNAGGAPDLVARRLIDRGDEVTFDYAMRNYSIEHFPARCRCGSPMCRGSVRGWENLPVERKQAYHGLVAPYLLQIDSEIASAAIRP